MQNEHQLDERLFQALPGVLIPNSRIKLLILPSAISKHFATQFDIPARITFLRKEALKNIGGHEVFLQKSFALGRLESAELVVVTISVLTTKEAWRGGWFMSLVGIGEEELFTLYLSQARESVVDGLRRERSSGGS